MRRIEAQMREQILNYSSQIQQQLKNNPTTLEIRAGADETFFPEVVLVLMDLVSGYIILEDFSQDRQYLTWSQKAEKALQNLGGMVVVKSIVSDHLSRLHHCGRGISQQQLPVLTVIHNFDLKRTDGTTAAQRLFSQEFPDLFEWVIAQMGDLPLPRKSYSF